MAVPDWRQQLQQHADGRRCVVVVKGYHFPVDTWTVSTDEALELLGAVEDGTARWRDVWGRLTGGAKATVLGGGDRPGDPA